MADRTAFPEEHLSEPLVYRRVSGFAIAALIVACGYALIIVITAVSGLYERTPVLLPPWIQAISIIGIGLSLAALAHIHYSEGTVAGNKLAVWGLLLSAFFGLSYASYYVATYFAIRQQADAFTHRWLEQVEQGKLNQAFLETQDPASRQRVNAEDEDAINARFPAVGRTPNPRTPLEAFRENEVVRMLSQGAGKLRITPLGVKDWQYVSGGYRVQRTYQIETPEGTFDLQVTEVGSESKAREYEGRKWHISMGQTRIQKAELSDLAKELTGLREQSSQFLEAWGNKLSSGLLGSAYLDTRPPAERAALAQELNRRRVLLPVLGLGVLTGIPSVYSELLIRIASPEIDDLARQLSPDYMKQFHQQGIVKTDKYRGADEETRQQVVNAVKGLFLPPWPEGPHLLGLKPGLGSVYQTWKIEGDRLKMAHDCRLMVSVGGKRYSIIVTAIVDSDPGPIVASRRPTWRIDSLELHTGEDMARMPPAPMQSAF